MAEDNGRKMIQNTNDEIQPLLSEVRNLIITARKTAAQNINTLQVLTNFEIGKLIVENEQLGDNRAEYGKQTLKDLSNSLTKEFGRGFSRSNLEYMRRFYIDYKIRAPSISQTASGKLSNETYNPSKISQTASAQLSHLGLSWSHYVFLMGIKGRDERQFYEIESSENSWSLAELKRQFNSGLYERLALSRDKEGVRDLSYNGQRITKPEDMIKNPLVLEFLGLDEKEKYSESDLEFAIINKLEHFLLEIGKGFLFESRQKRFTFDSDHYYVDLVFYNRLLHCYVLVDLKIGKLTHQNLGQMQMYVNYFDRHVKLDDENQTIGIILCKTDNDALVQLTLPEDTNVYASRYQLYLPSKEVLRQKLIEWSNEGMGETFP